MGSCISDELYKQAQTSLRCLWVANDLNSVCGMGRFSRGGGGVVWGGGGGGGAGGRGGGGEGGAGGGGAFLFCGGGGGRGRGGAHCYETAVRDRCCLEDEGMALDAKLQGAIAQADQESCRPCRKAV